MRFDDHQTGGEFNFWPAFADMMLACVLVLVLVYSVTVLAKKTSEIDLRDTRSRQKELVDLLAEAYNTEAHLSSETQQKWKYVWHIYIDVHDSSQVIVVANDLKLQKVSFSDRILFEANDATISDIGKHALHMLGQAIVPNFGSIREIQIQGHADWRRPTNPKYKTNLELAAARSVSVYDFLQNEMKINPAEHLMSATSFAEFKPVQRTGDELDYNMERLGQDNDSAEKMRRNRRIEILLFNQ